MIEPQIWELTDRVLNFEFVEESARARLREFQMLIEAATAVDIDAAWAELAR